MSARSQWLGVCLLSMVALSLSTGGAYGQCTDVEINGSVLSGKAAVWYELSPLLFEPIVHKDPIFPAEPLTDTAGAMVMIQDMHTGDFVAYGAFTPGTNLWTACVPVGGTYIAMISAPGHNLTSRVYDTTQGTVFPQVVTDAYLPALNQDLATGAVDPANPEQPMGNLLVYAFEENAVNGAPDWPVDPGLPGVFMELYEPRTGNVVRSGYTQAGGPGAPTINTADGLVFSGAAVSGLLYLQDIPPGEYRLRATPGTTDADGLVWDQGWYHTYTMEGTQEWEILVYPGDPGTEAGAFLAWFGFAKKLGQLAPGAGGSSISGVVEDADVGWEAPIPGEPPEPGTPLDPMYRNQGVSTNGPVPDAFLILWRRIGDTFQVIATTDADPVTGAFSFNNVPAGQFNIFFVDIPLKHIFGEMQVTTDGVNPVVIPPISQEVPGLPLAIIARFGARVRGYVIDDVTGIPMNGATVNLRYKAGNVAYSTVTANDPVRGDGWYEFDFLPEIETMAFLDVEPPAGYRGRTVTDTYYPTAHVPPDPNCDPNIDPVCIFVPLPCNPDPNAPNYDPNCVVPGTAVPVDRNGMNRYVQYYTANYKSDLILEPIPAGVGHIQGLVFNDSLDMGTWLPDGIYDNVEEGIIEGVTIQLLDATGAIIPLLDPVTGQPVTDPITGLPVQDPTTLTATGAFTMNDVILNQGYIAPGISVPPDEWGGFFSGPMPGHYEFRDVTPGTYTLRITLPIGFQSPTEAVDPVTGLGLGYVDQQITVADSASNDVNFGVHTRVPQAGQLEGGIFDDQNLDLRWYSALAEEKQVLVGLGVTVRDYLGFQLDTLIQPSPVCYPGTSLAADAPPGYIPQPYGFICDRPELGSDVEIDRMVAPGLRLYWGNDPSLPPCSGADGSPMPGDPPCHNPNLFDLELPYTMGQGLAKYEADWSLPAAIPGAGNPPLPDCPAAIQITAMSATSTFTEDPKWTVSVTLTVADPIGPLPGANVSASWSTGAVSTAITNVNGNAILVLETIEDPAIVSVTATMTVTPGEGSGGVFNPGCGVFDCIEVNRPDIGGFILCGGPVPVCGDGILDPGEDSCNCPADAGPPGDADGDGVNDCLDICPGFDDTIDLDMDGVPDGCDLCPGDPLKDEPGFCGCGVADVDTDGDGTLDCNDLCPNDPNKIDPGNCGCGVPEADCGVCVPAGVVVASLSGNAIPMEKAKWRAEVTVNFEDATCGLPFTLTGGDSILYNFGGESKTAEANGGSFMIVGSETIDGVPMVTFAIDSVNIPGWDAANSQLSVVIGQPNPLVIVPEIRPTIRKVHGFDSLFSAEKGTGSCGMGAAASAGLLSFVGLIGMSCRRRRRRFMRRK